MFDVGRKKPYTEAGIKRMQCARCGKLARHQWRACADGLWRPICTECDIDLNRLVLEWLGHPDVQGKMEVYKQILEDLE